MEYYIWINGESIEEAIRSHINNPYTNLNAALDDAESQEINHYRIINENLEIVFTKNEDGRSLSKHKVVLKEGFYLKKISESFIEMVLVSQSPYESIAEAIDDAKREGMTDFEIINHKLENIPLK